MTIKYEELAQFRIVESDDYDWCSMGNYLTQKGLSDKGIKEVVLRLPYIDLPGEAQSDQIDWELLKMQGGVEIDNYPDYEIWCRGLERKGKILITSAETADEALSDFIGYHEIDPTVAIDENSVGFLSDVIKYFGGVENIELQNIISLDNDLPEDIDGWYAVRCVE